MLWTIEKIISCQGLNNNVPEARTPNLRFCPHSANLLLAPAFLSWQSHDTSASAKKNTDGEILSVPRSCLRGRSRDKNVTELSSRNLPAVMACDTVHAREAYFTMQFEL